MRLIYSDLIICDSERLQRIRKYLIHINGVIDNILASRRKKWLAKVPRDRGVL